MAKKIIVNIIGLLYSFISMLILSLTIGYSFMMGSKDFNWTMLIIGTILSIIIGATQSQITNWLNKNDFLK